jgi:PAS domain-containing protein
MKSGTAVKSRKDREASRCAIFKIDLGGRFVYIDEKTEKLLKVPSESLFGQNIDNYLDKNSAETIRDILNYGRLYETFYEYADLKFIDSAQQIHPCDVIISLNFIGGNPANFQVVVAPENKIERGPAESTPEYEWEQPLYSWLAELHDSPDWEELLELLLIEDGIVQTALYLIWDDNLEFLAGKSRPEYSKKGYDLSIIDDQHKKAVEQNNPIIIDGRDKFDGLTDACYPLICRDQLWGMLRIVTVGGFKKLSRQLAAVAGFLGNGLAGYFSLEESSRHDE